MAFDSDWTGLGAEYFGSRAAISEIPGHGDGVCPSIWSIVVDGVTWSCEFRFDGESYGWDVRLNRAGEFFASHRFLLRQPAEQWAADQRRDIERGWVEST